MSFDGRRVAIVEDDPVMGESLALCLTLEGAETALARTGAEARALLGAGAFDALVCDIRLPDTDGEALFRALRAAPPTLFLTAHSDIDQAVRLLKAGAADYMTKPFEQATFLDRLARILPPALDPSGAALGTSEAMRAVERLLLRVAPRDLPVLLTGETGTGKEVAARFLHAASPRAAGPFVAVNCAAIPAELFESAMFGHERGAFTGAASRHAGFVEQARRGVLFLDEVGELPAPAQAKILRFLEDRRFRRVGGEATLAADLRVLAATNRDLGADVAAGRFREDLLFRLNVVELRLPPLRERPEDALWLLRRRLGDSGEARALSGQAEEAALGHDWPGNAREARNRLERALALAEGSVIDALDLFPESAAIGYAGRGIEPLAEIRAAAERRQIRRALRETRGRVAEAATLLDVSRTTLWEKMRRLGVAE